MAHPIRILLAVLCLIVSMGDAEAKTCKSKKVTGVGGGIPGGQNRDLAKAHWAAAVASKYGAAYADLGIAKSKSLKCKLNTSKVPPTEKCTLKAKPCKP